MSCIWIAFLPLLQTIPFWRKFQKKVIFSWVELAQLQQIHPVTIWVATPGVHFTAIFFSNPSLGKILTSYNQNYQAVITNKFCICHDSCAVMAYAIFFSNLMVKYHKYSKLSYTRKLNFSRQILTGMGPGPQFQSWLILTCCNEIDGRVAGINRMKLLPTSPGNNNSWNGYHYHYHPWKTDSSILYIKIQWAYSWFNPICVCFCIQIWHQAFNYLRGRERKRKIFHQWMNNVVNCIANFTAIIKSSSTLSHWHLTHLVPSYWNNSVLLSMWTLGINISEIFIDIFF